MVALYMVNCCLLLPLIYTIYNKTYTLWKATNLSNQKNPTPWPYPEVHPNPQRRFRRLLDESAG